MKQTFFLLCTLISLYGQAQQDTIAPAYKRYPTIPALQLLLSDSATVYKKDRLPHDKPVLIMLFSPECSHCNHTADEMEQLKDSLQNIEIVMATMHPIWLMKDFAERHKLTDWKNIVFGKDIYYILPSFYQVRSLPFMALYDKKGNLIGVHEGSLPMSHVIELFREHE
jgi:thioredoxin-related protein